METEKKRHEAICCSCGHKFFACKSLAQILFGNFEMGHGSCPKCNQFLNLKFNPETEKMETMKWDDFINGKKNSPGG